MHSEINAAPTSLWVIIRTDWKWWLSGAILSIILTSVLIAGGASGLVPNIDYPFTYNGDGVFIAIQRLIEGWNFDNPRSGYPFGSSLLDYPASDSGNYLILKLIGTFASHWYSVFNIYYLLGFAVTFVASFCVLRTVGLAIPFAFAAATLFNFLPFHFERIDHTFFTWYFVVPVFYYVALRIFHPSSLMEISGSSAPKKFFYAVCLMILGSFGVYYAIFGLIILTVIIISSLIGYRPPNSFRISFFAACIVVLGVLLNLAPNLIHRFSEGPNPEVAQRSIGESEIYAFKFAQLVLPRSGHRNNKLADISSKYSANTPWITENGTATLGAIGTLGLLAALGIIFSTLVGKEQNGTLRIVSLTLLVLFMFGTVGGFGVIFAQIISPSIRAWNRISVFISFGALLVFFMLLQSQVTKYFSGRRLTILSIIFSLTLLLVGLFDQTTTSCKPCNEQVKMAFNSDRDFIRSIESSLPTGSAIYQLPYWQFPEPNPPYYRLPAYDLSLGFVHSSSLRWSFGGMKGRRGDLFYRSLSKEPFSRQLEVIQRLGMAGIYVDRRGFEDGGKAAIDAFTALLGTPPTFARTDGEIVFFRIPLSEPSINLEGLKTEQIMQKANYAVDQWGHRIGM